MTQYRFVDEDQSGYRFVDEPNPVKQGTSWANEAIAAVPDAVLNTPTNLWNLAKAGFGTAATAMGRPDLAPNLTQQPNIVSGLFENAGLTAPAEMAPTTTSGRLAKAGVQGLTVGALAPAQSVPQMVSNMTMSGLSGVIGQGTTDATGSPELGMAATMATVPALSAASNATRKNSMEAKSRNSLKDQTLEDARKEGYVVPPSAAGGNWFSRRLESIAGKAAIGQESSVRNQQVTNEIARRELNLPENAPISVQVLEARRNVLAEPYRQISSMNKQAGPLLEELKQARADANLSYRHYDVSADPKSLKEADKLMVKADAIESRLEVMAKRAMQPKLVNALREARQAIAKTYDVERGLNVATGDVSASVLGRAVDKGKPLTGGLATIGKFQQGFPAYARDGERVSTPGVSKSEAILSLMLGSGGAAFGGPFGALLGAVPLASGPVRSGLLSKPYQAMGPSYPGASLPKVSDPLLRSILASGLISPTSPE
jgi:hypothetical protein